VSDFSDQDSLLIEVALSYVGLSLLPFSNALANRVSCKQSHLQTARRFWSLRDRYLPYCV